ncbi:MAG: nucleoside 2-deoxyribosyltransferase [Proteobacteria bacterium]|nr:nucleoside 2-deoxyribosyltransferase [Pseudomonadota bacterium]
MKIYFAHPCFTEKQIEFKKNFLKIISHAVDRNKIAMEIIIIDPFEHTPNIEGDIETKLLMSMQIMEKCLQLLVECDIVIALVDGDDTGTAFESGYAYAINKPVILVSETLCSRANAMLIGPAKAMIDNVLDKDQMNKLILTIKSFHNEKHC